MLGLLASKSRRAETNETPIREYLLLTRYSPQRVKLGEMLSVDDVQEILSLHLLGVIPESKAVLNASNSGNPVVIDEKSDAGQAYFDVVSVQNLYNVGDRSAEALAEYSTANGIGFIPWFPLGNRALLGEDGPLAAIAARVGATPGQVALAWLLQHSPVMLPIPGTGSLDHLAENCDAALVTLDAQTVAELDALAR